MSEEAPEVTAGRGRWRSRLKLGGAALLGAAIVGVFWVVLGGGNSGSAESFQVSAGIPPVVFLYLDNVHIASYLAQLQGGAATTEQLSRQATQSRSATFGADGVGAGASSSQQSTASLSLTVNDQSRFTDLLGLLQSDGFLHTIDMTASDAMLRRELAAVPVGSFVKLSACSLSLPGYVQDEQLWRASNGRIGVNRLLNGAGPAAIANGIEYQAIKDKAKVEGKKAPLTTGSAEVAVGGRLLRKARSQMRRLARQAGANPRVPLSSCSPGDYDPRAPDLLMPIRLAGFTANQSALAGRVTLVGKVMLAVRKPAQDYVDLDSLEDWSGGSFWTAGLARDVTVLAPGYVIQPIAIYK